MRLGPAVLVVLAGVIAGGAPALAQSTAQPATFAPRTGHPGRDTLLRMSRPITIAFEGQRLEDVLKFITEVSGADIEPMWIDDRNSEGLDKDLIINLSVDRISLLDLMERLMDEARTDFEENTWQLTEFGALEVGPKSRLNRRKRVHIYDINDMLVDIPTYDQVPQIDLQSVLQSGEGGSGQSPFRDDQQGLNDEDRRSKQDKAEEIIDLLVELVEPDQWQDRGGEGGSIRYFQGHIIVNAPDYMHRQLDGYAFWPASATRFAKADNGRRYVRLDMDAGTSILKAFGQEPVTAVVGGRIIRSDRPGGGG